MDTLFDLRPTHNPHRWFMPVIQEICVGPPGNLFMFGGVGLASAITAMERTTGRPVIWATAQYISFAKPPAMLDLDVWIMAGGRYNTQARVVSHVGDKEIITVNAALGQRPSDISKQWVQAPDAPPPEDCPEHPFWRAGFPDLPGRVEVREVPRSESMDDGRSLLWARPRERFPIDAGMLALLADLAPSGLTHALGRTAHANSLDNTLRVRRVVPTEWVLCDIRTEGAHGGFAHADMRLFAQDGELMATASQSMILRL